MALANWATPVLIGLTVVLLARAYYVLHFLKRGNRFSMATTWLATVFVIGFWTWQWVLKQ